MSSIEKIDCMKNISRFTYYLLTIIFILVGWWFWQRNTSTKANWQFLIKDQVGAQSVLNVGKNLSFDEDSLYFGDGKGLIHALEKHSGKIRWTHQLADHSPFQITQDSQFLYIASFDSHIYKLDKNNGFVVWSYPIPNFFWPDTEVIFDNNDEQIFFADRGGFLYALNKSDGKEVWRQQFEAIDTSRSFVENSIHFGFLYQNEDAIVADHFPSKTSFTINKKDGSIIKQEPSKLEIPWAKIYTSMPFAPCEIQIKNNVIDQPLLQCVTKEQKTLWSYQTEHRLNMKEIYQDGNRIYYLNGDNTLLTSLLIDKKDPSNQSNKRINFQFKENFAAHHPYKNTNPQVDSEFKESSFSLVAQNQFDYLEHVLQNKKAISQFQVQATEKTDYLELAIQHQENLYHNVFTDVAITATLSNEADEKITVKGFYDDTNNWKIRAQLDKGYWDYRIKIQTPLWKKTIVGRVEIKQEKTPRITISNDVVTKKTESFLALGLQDVILDTSRDGNPFNDMGHAARNTPPTNQKEYQFLDFTHYLDLYQKEAGMNIFRYGPDNWAPSIWENLSAPDSFAMRINGNKQGDFIIEQARQRGYSIMMSIFGFYPPYISKEAVAKKSNQQVLEHYLDYVIARYGASVDIWELTNEALPSLEWLNFISNYLRENDPYKRPITTNLEETRLDNSDLLSIHYYPEAPKNNAELVEKITQLTKQHDWSKAKIISEFGFAKANHFNDSAAWLRKFAWALSFNKIGIISWNTAYGLYQHTSNGNVYLGPEERNYLNILRQFFPSMNQDLQNNHFIDAKAGVTIYELTDESHQLLYALKTDLSKKEPVVINLTTKKSGTVTFLNPKTGAQEHMQITATQQTITLPDFSDDLAIKIRYE